MAVGQRPNVRDEAPNLIVADSAAPRGHAIGATFVDRLEHVARRSAEVPTIVLQARPHRARSFRAMAIETVVRDEQLCTLGDLRGVALEGIGERAETRLQRKTRLYVVGVLDEIRWLCSRLRRL